MPNSQVTDLQLKKKKNMEMEMDGIKAFCL